MGSTVRLLKSVFNKKSNYECLLILTTLLMLTISCVYCSHHRVSTVQRVLSKEGTQLPQTALTRDTWQSSRASCSSPDATYKSINADEPVPNLHLSEPQVFQAQHSETCKPFFSSERVKEITNICEVLICI